MSGKLCRFSTMVGIVLVLAAPILAHHPFSAEYDWKKPVTLSGTVTKFDWSNPHAQLFVDVKDNNGRTASWTFELGGLSALSKGGWNKDSIKSGDVVTIDAWMARSKSNAGNVKSIKLSNGHELSGASSIGDPVATSDSKSGN